MKPVSRRRIAIDVDDETYMELQKTFRWGERNDSMIRLLQWLIDKRKTMEPSAFYAICRSGLFDMLLKDQEAANGDTRRLGS